MRRSLAILLILSAVPSFAQPITGAFLESDPGDTVAAGYPTRTFQYDATDQVLCGWWNFNPPPVPYYVTCSIGPAVTDPNRPRVYLTFNERTRVEAMKRGVYESSWASPHNFFLWWPHPGLHVKFENGLSPYEATGRFAVLDYETQKIDGVLTPVRFSAYFEQHWANQRPALRGYFYWNYSPTVTVSLVSQTVTGGQKTRARVTLAKPAPAGGAIVTLRSSNALAALSRTEVTIAEGGTGAEVDVTTSVARWTDDVLIYAEHAGVGSVAPLTVLSPYTARTELDVNGVRTVGTTEAWSVSAAVTTTTVPTALRIRDTGWQIDLDTHATHAPLRAGTYANVQSLGSAGPFAQMSVGRDGVDLCASRPFRSFTVLDATYDETFNVAVLKSLAV